MKTKIIKLPKGGNLEVSMTKKFLNVVSNHFKLSCESDVTDEHIRMFVYGSFKNAIDTVDKNHLK
tara:strand:- start:354 stop:548 length:195 start_codon:yes stop_codon:yes gene_type:complete